MTNRQKIFCNEYLISLNATNAAIKAGYSEKTANEQGARLLANVSVQEYLKKKMQKREEKLEITAERVLKELARIAFFDPAKMFDDKDNLLKITEMDEDTRRVIAGIDISAAYKPGLTKEEKISEIVKKLKLVDKKGALELLGRHLSMWNDKLEVEVKRLMIDI